jgi:two-component system NtrC family sensor kinase
VTLRIIHRVLVAVVAVSVAVLGGAAWIASRAQDAALSARVERHALVLAETIQNATRHAMLLDQRDMVQNTLETIGRQSGLDQLRVMSKEGRVVFAPDRARIGERVDLRSETCGACHAGRDPGSGLPTERWVREFRDAAGVRRLGVISPILNGDSCSTAACHAHPADQQVLGVLELNVSLADVDREVARNRRVTVLLSVAAITGISLLLWVILRRLVGRPVARLLAATRAVSEGDLSRRLPVQRSDELSQLAAAFNQMTVRLSEARDQVYQSNKLASLGRLAAGIAHEINNPLTGVLTYSSFLLKRASDGETRQDLETIVHETKRCREIVRGLLDFARQVPPKKTATDVNAIVARALDIVDNQLRVQNIQVTQSLRPDLPRIHADPNQLQQVLINLLVNAADSFDGAEREIYIATELTSAEPGAQVVIKVADTGAGIPEKHLGKIFEPFFTTKDHKGTGLGLAVVWGIIGEHGGTIEVDSKVGRGTTFTVRLPVESAAAPAERGAA